MLSGLAYALLWIALLAYVTHARAGTRWAGWIGTGVTALSAILFLVALAQRAHAAGHWPLTNRYECALCLVWTILAIYLLLELSWRERRAGAFVLAIALLVATYALTRPAEMQAIAPLLPALRSAWLPVHVLSTLIGYGAFGVAGGLGLMRLIQKPVHSPNGNGMEKPRLSEDELERTIERAVALGLPWLTLGILTGAIWAQRAWGRYWGWDPKETWTLVTWLWYILVWHVWPLPAWRGRRLAALAVAGFGLVCFTFIGVPWLVRIVRLESLHGF